MGRLQENSEILTVVDEHDRVIGARRRDEIHLLGPVSYTHLTLPTKA